MKKLESRILFLTVVALIGCGDSPKSGNSVGRGFLIADYFPTDPDTRLTYKLVKNGVESQVLRKFTKIEDRATGKRYWEFSMGEDVGSGYLSDEGLELERIGQAVLSPPVLTFHKSVHRGDLITTPTTLQSPTSPVALVFTCKVEAVTRLTTPAGDFDNCIQYALYTKPASSPSELGNIRRRGWLASGIGLVQAEEYAPDGKLVSTMTLLSTQG